MQEDRILVNSEIFWYSNGRIHYLEQIPCNAIIQKLNQEDIEFTIIVKDYIFLYSSSADSVYEAANMSVNVGLWYMKHAAMIAAKDE